MKIKREFIGEEKVIPENCWTKELFHIIDISYDSRINELNIKKQINYIVGHGHEQCDKIHCYGYGACYKTHNLEYLNENEDKIIQDLINEIYSDFNRKIKKYKIDIDNIEERIDIEENNKKNFSELIREQKIKRLI
jgi:ribosomal protein L20A (L18A)